MTGLFVSATLSPATGAVHLLRSEDGELWRRAVAPHDIAELDRYAPELPADQRAAILADWAARPVASPDEIGADGAMT